MRIKVEGTVGEGKTTMALELATHLRALGFKVTLEDDDVAFGVSYPELQPLRLQALVEDAADVVVQTVRISHKPR